MSSRPELKLDWCSHAAAKFAVEHWHYSRVLPKSKSVYMGVWESGKFIGVIIFGLGASSHLGSPYGLKTFEAAELTRVALTNHVAAVSKIISIAFKFIKKQSPGLRLIVSYADPSQSHHGGIYQAGNWVYVGKTNPDWAVIDKNGKQWHSRICSVNGLKSQFGVKRKAMRPQDGTKIILPGKHRYLMPLDSEMRKRILPLAKPYPKRAGSIASDVSAIHAEEGGSTPTPALQLDKQPATVNAKA
jgi:hypothetical protein